MAEPQKSALQTIYHIKDGAQQLFAIDARHALSNFPKEWSAKPWLKEGEQEVIDIPEGWQDSNPSARIALAAKLGADRKGLTAAKADEVIEAEVERRAAADAQPAAPKA